MGQDGEALGEWVTDENVFLGDVYGLWTNTVAFFKKGADKPKGGWGYPSLDNMNAYDIVSRQATQFMTSHIQEITKLIDELSG